MPITSQRDLQRRLFLELADTLGQNQEFCALVQGHDDDRDTQLGSMILEASATVGYEIHQSQSISQSFVTRLGTADPVQLSPAALRLKEMFQEYKSMTAKRRCIQRKVADRISFKEKDIDFRGLPDNIPVVFVDPLPIPYPPKDHIVLERHYSTVTKQKAPSKAPSPGTYQPST